MQVMTILGPILPEKLGVTLIHEHVFYNASHLLRDFDVILDNAELAVKELMAFKEKGGSGLVDVTPIGVGRDALLLKRVAKETGLHIIAGTGFYIEDAHPAYVRDKSVDELADIMIRDISDGIVDSGVRAGIIGEIGTGAGFISPAEERVLRAAARAQLQTGAPLSTHAAGGIALRQIEILSEEDVNPKRVIVGHMDTGPTDIEYHLAVAQAGVYVGYDQIGKTWRGPDTLQLDVIVSLIKRGYVRQIVLSHDICRRVYLHEYGGFGYDHLLRNFVPMLRRAGVAEGDIRAMLVENPQQALAF